MARTPTNPPAVIPAPQATEQAALVTIEAQNAASEIARTQDDILAAGIDIGRLEAMTFITTIGENAAVAIYENIKKSKAWRHLKNPVNSDGRNFESIDEFCRVKLGKSYNRMQELCANRSLLGQEAFEQSERLGLRQVDYNAIKALPQPKQEIIREALAEAASKEDIQRALRELAAADQREIEALTQSVEKAEAARRDALEELQTAADRRAKLLDEIDHMHGEVARLKRKGSEPVKPDEELVDLRAEADRAAQQVRIHLDSSLRAAMTQIVRHHETHGGDSARVMAAWLDGVQDAVTEMRNTFGLAGLVGGQTDNPLDWIDLPEAIAISEESMAKARASASN